MGSLSGLPSFTLQSGAKIPAVAYGTGTLWFKDASPSADRKVVNGIRTAIDAGYRHLDGAQMYNTEHELGVAIQESGVPRNEIFLTTKAQSLDNIEESLEESLAKMQVSFVDLYLIHSPFSSSGPEILQSAWKKMERCVERGLARHIGVSNFARQHLDTILAIATIKPAVNQIEMHPYLQQDDLLAYLKEKDILTTGFAPLTPLTKFGAGPVRLVCARLAEKYKVSESAILLRWAIDQGAAVVTTSGKRERLDQYLAEVPSFRLSSEEVGEISHASKDHWFRGFFSEEFQAIDKAKI